MLSFEKSGKLLKFLSLKKIEYIKLEKIKTKIITTPFNFNFLKRRKFIIKKKDKKIKPTKYALRG
jgi:hypothetical protein